MKKLFLFAFLLSTKLSAQQLELGFTGGISTNTKPSDNMLYKAAKPTLNYAVVGSVMYNINRHFQVGIQYGASELSARAADKYFYAGQFIGGDNKRFVYGKLTSALCVISNAKLNLGKGYLYGGVAVGYGATRHNSKTLSSNEAFRAPNGGDGWVAGGQVGYVLGFTSRLAFNAEIAARYFKLYYDAKATTGEQLRYSITSFPVTVGFRYRLFDEYYRESNRQRSMNIGGD